MFHQEDGGIPPGGIYSDPDKDNPWRGVDIVHAGNDGEAVSAARQLKHLPEATSLYLGKRVTDTGLAAIGDAGLHPSLASIDFFQSPVTAVGLSHLAKLPQLRHLFFNTCPIQDSDLASLKLITSLRRLTLLEEAKQANPNRFSESGFQELGQLKSLEFLWFVRLNVSDGAARHLKGLTDLKTLRFSLCHISDQAVAELREALPNCEINVVRSEPSAPAK